MRVYGRTCAGCAVVTGAMAIAAWQLGGCAGGLANLVPKIPIPIDLGGGLGTFEAHAGTPVRNMGSASFDTQQYTIGSGSIVLDPSDITVTPTAGPGAKGAVNLQQTSTLEVTVWIAPADQQATVCDTGEQYGPFDVTLDANYVPTAISPASVTLTATTIGLLNAGGFSLCLELISPIDATVTIASMTFNLGA